MKSYFVAAVMAVSAFADDCSWFQNLQCTSGDQTKNPDDWADRAFQTPLQSSTLYQDSFQGLGRVMCYNHI